MTKSNIISHCPAYLAGSSIYQPSTVSLLCLLPPHMLLLLVHYLYSNWNPSFIRTQLCVLLYATAMNEWPDYIKAKAFRACHRLSFFILLHLYQHELSPKHSMYFRGPCLAITNFPHHPIKPPKYQQYFSNLLQEESKPRAFSPLYYIYNSVYTSANYNTGTCNLFLDCEFLKTRALSLT